MFVINPDTIKKDTPTLFKPLSSFLETQKKSISQQFVAITTKKDQVFADYIEDLCYSYRKEELHLESKGDLKF